MPINTKFNPQNVSQFEKAKLNFNSHGVACNPDAGTTTNLDYTLVDDCLITGLELIVDNATLGDYLHLQVVDIGGIMSPPGTILLQPATNWYVYTTSNTQFDIAYPAKIFAGLTIRVVYTSTGETNPFLAANFKLHKVLI